MDLTHLTSISPLDGRYRGQCEILSPFFSEFALIHYRVRVEVEYFIALCQMPLPQLQGVGEDKIGRLRHIYNQFGPKDALAIKTIEQSTNHDVKAVEYFLKEKFAGLGLAEYREFVHFGLTSQDINNTAIPLSLKEGIEQIVLPALIEVQSTIEGLGESWKSVPMLARTHGQPASPTTIGKELLVFSTRLAGQLEWLQQAKYNAKFGGATGNFNAHHAAYPDIEWHEFAREFINKLGLTRSYPTTQIEHYDNLAFVFDALRRINNVLIDFCRDLWQYVSLNYFKQKIKPGEVGSSAMPHKVNPIDFENAEGNLGVANALLGHLSDKLPISRLQRDLTDSTVLRNIGVPFGHILISVNSIRKGISKLELNESALQADLANNWAVVAEGIQNILRREGYPNPYEALMELTRTNSSISEDTIREFIQGLDVPENVKEELMFLSPFNYTGKV